MPKLTDKDLNEFEWRTGKKKTSDHKNVYAQMNAMPSKSDVLIGAMKSPTMAEQVVNDHNGWFD